VETYLGRIVEQKLGLGCSFRCNHIYGKDSYEFGHTLLCLSGPTKMLNKPAYFVYGSYLGGEPYSTSLPSSLVFPGYPSKPFIQSYLFFCNNSSKFWIRRI